MSVWGLMSNMEHTCKVGQLLPRLLLCMWICICTFPPHNIRHELTWKEFGLTPTLMEERDLEDVAAETVKLFQTASPTWTRINISASDVEPQARAPGPPKSHPPRPQKPFSASQGVASDSHFPLQPRRRTATSKGSRACWVIACVWPLATGFDVTSRSAISPIK